ncbi:WD40/YVTN repeat-like-containing domain protein [Niveomyces insectorum RCEF 264]|uniref:WD40/YVTN repeat-like-containing domain protein n=1 Tax=Niveomyces insectorum RCEF 264 TaxID=1081102 RepID=A0A167T9T3_9HYPO|nr:WD40/YVTN repeat-like-containing domain protein [Niveomyces insectorum RCEF 264]
MRSRTLTAAVATYMATLVVGSPLTVELPPIEAFPINVNDIISNLPVSPLKRDTTNALSSVDPKVLTDLVSTVLNGVLGGLNKRDDVAGDLPLAGLDPSVVEGVIGSLLGHATKRDENLLNKISYSEVEDVLNTVVEGVVSGVVDDATAALPAGVLRRALLGEREPLGISIPGGLIPAIPGVTEPLNGLVPPLPVLQAPLPALESPPFTPSNLQPKKIGYFWTGSGDNEHKDFLVTASLDDDTFGTIIDVTDVPTSGNSPHHLGVSADGTTLVGGGLLSLLKTQDTGFYFNVSNPYRPTFLKSNRGLLSSIVDEIRAKPDGGFFITYMGSAAGTSPGRLVETDADYNIIHEWPEDVGGTLNILDSQFSPHGLSIDFDKDILLTSDFIVPLSILKPTTGIQRADTLRLWRLSDRTILSTITIPNGGGIQDVKFIPGHPESAALATAVVPGQVWIVYPFRTDGNGNQGVAELLIDLGPKAQNTLAIYSDISPDGRLAYFTFTLGNHVAAFDISDLNNVKRLDDPDADQPIIGPHYVKIAPDQKHLLVTGYFVQAGDISIVNTPGDYKGHWIDILDDGSLSFNRSIDFETIFSTTRGGARPHSSVIFDFTDPANPKRY